MISNPLEVAVFDAIHDIHFLASKRKKFNLICLLFVPFYFFLPLTIKKRMKAFSLHHNNGRVAISSQTRKKSLKVIQR
jgi:hypothetical protein